MKFSKLICSLAAVCCVQALQAQSIQFRTKSSLPQAADTAKPAAPVPPAQVTTIATQPQPPKPRIVPDTAPPVIAAPSSVKPAAAAPAAKAPEVAPAVNKAAPAEHMAVKPVIKEKPKAPEAAPAAGKMPPADPAVIKPVITDAPKAPEPVPVAASKTAPKENIAVKPVIPEAAKAAAALPQPAAEAAPVMPDALPAKAPQPATRKAKASKAKNLAQTPRPAPEAQPAAAAMPRPTAPPEPMAMEQPAAPDTAIPGNTAIQPETPPATPAHLGQLRKSTPRSYYAARNTAAMPAAAPASAAGPDDINIKHGPINQTDGQGKKQGLWREEQPSQRGEDGYTAYGSYEHGLKNGIWYKVSSSGDIIAAETYWQDVLNGEAKYYEQGRLTVIGHYRGLNPDHEFDTIDVVDPITRAEVPRVIRTEKGAVKHGAWTYYDMNTGDLIREEEYQVDDLIYHKSFSAPPRDSSYNKAQEQKMRFNQPGPYYAPPKKKQVSYTN